MAGVCLSNCLFSSAAVAPEDQGLEKKAPSEPAGPFDQEFAICSARACVLAPPNEKGFRFQDPVARLSHGVMLARCGLHCQWEQKSGTFYFISLFYIIFNGL
jgi:hypothetical protein